MEENTLTILAEINKIKRAAAREEATKEDEMVTKYRAFCSDIADYNREYGTSLDPYSIILARMSELE